VARELALNAIEMALNAVDPRGVIKSRVSLVDDILKIDDRTFDLSAFKRVFVVGGGKASGSMAEALEEILGNHIDDGVVVIQHGTKENYRTKKIKLHEAGHPIPDDYSMDGAKKILNLVAQADKDDLVICLISGGGSSLMCLPREGISLDDKQLMTRLLLNCGATINEINTVRKHISSFKGGQLAREAYPATLISLILSDVVGDPLEVIASGPTVPDPTTFKDAIEILKRYNIWNDAPKSIRDTLLDGLSGRIMETPKAGDPTLSKVNNIIIGSNRLASMAAVDSLKRQGLNTMFLTSFMEGEAREVGIMLAALAREAAASNHPIPKPFGIVIGGETTVTVTGNGIGGRNQEIALSAAMKINGLDGIVIVSASTDGIDGPTDAAGAIADGYTMMKAREFGLDAKDYLKNNDSYTFFSKVDDLVFTGPTGTNVNDISVIVCL